MAANAKGKQFKVTGLGEKNQQDITVMVKAASIDAAKTEAIKKEPALEKYKDVRVYARGDWVRVA